MKVKGPLYSISASGKIFDNIVFSQRASGQQARLQRSQKDVITSARTAQRDKYITAVAGWNALDPIDKALFDDRAKNLHMTGYNLYIKENIGGVTPPGSRWSDVKVYMFEYGITLPATSPPFDCLDADLIVVVRTSYMSGGTGTNIIDSESNSYTQSTDHNGSGAAIQIMYKVAPVTSATQTFTSSASGDFYGTMHIFVIKCSGGCSFESQSGSNSGSATSIQPGSLTPSVDDCLIVAGLNNYVTTVDDAAISSPFSLDTHHAWGDGFFSVAGAMGHYIQPVAGAVNPTFSWSETQQAGSAMLVFKPN